MYRLSDLVLASLGLLIFAPLFVIIYIAGFFDTGKPIFRQLRVGRNQKPFTLFKFRTMKPDTVVCASHLADISAITPLGVFLRHSKLDELPQLWNVLIGDMSLVGPRPCLIDQSELIAEREKRGVYNFKPGITGLAQLCGIDMSTPSLLAETDAKLLSGLTFWNYYKYIFMTLIGKGSGDKIRGQA